MEAIPKEPKTVEQELMKSSWPRLCQPYPCLLLCDRDQENNDRQTFYDILENQYETRLLPELQNKSISCCYREWLVLLDYSTHDCSLLNILTMEQLQFPPLEISKHHYCMLSPTTNGGWFILFLEGHLYKAKSCYLGDDEFFEDDLSVIVNDLVDTVTNFGGTLYALTAFYNLHAVDVADYGLDFTQVINGQSIWKLLSQIGDGRHYLVESCGEFFFIFINYFGNKVVDLKILRADFDSGEWVRLDRLGDRAIFVDASCCFSARASVNGLKANSIYLVNKGSRNLNVYDIEDQSFSMTVRFPINSKSAVFWISVPNETSSSYPFPPARASW